jgi:hypothetical protein
MLMARIRRIVHITRYVELSKRSYRRKTSSDNWGRMEQARDNFGFELVARVENFPALGATFCTNL